jgi:hypothetical protein
MIPEIYLGCLNMVSSREELMDIHCKGPVATSNNQYFKMKQP